MLGTEEEWHECRREIRRLRVRLEEIAGRQQALGRLVANFLRLQGTGIEIHDQARLLSQFSLLILGGEDAQLGQFDECCAVGAPNDSVRGWQASGVLVAPQLVATAAHTGYAKAPPNEVALRVTDVETTPLPSGAEEIAGVFHGHVNYRGDGPFDIAAMRLATASQVFPVPLASTVEMQQATEVTLAGFGIDGRSPFGVLRFATVPIVFLQGGVKNDPSAVAGFGIDLASEFVAGVNLKGACSGDSGGPAYIQVAGQKKLAGLISRGPGDNCSGITILTRIDSYRAWLGLQ